MPRFHAGWSLGSVAGAGGGVAATALGVPIAVHVSVLAVLGLVATLTAAAWFLPVATQPSGSGRPRARSAWTESRTLLVGLMVLTFALAEGIANDWLSLAIIDGHDTPRWVGVTGFTLFVTAMTSGRLVGPSCSTAMVGSRCCGRRRARRRGRTPDRLRRPPGPDRCGRRGLGLGASLGFPVGMSAAADDPARAAARVSVVSTIGYGGFLAGPPLVGHLADLVGTLDALLVVVVLMVPAALTAAAARPVRTAA